MQTNLSTAEDDSTIMSALIVLVVGKFKAIVYGRLHGSRHAAPQNVAKM